MLLIVSKITMKYIKCYSLLVILKNKSFICNFHFPSSYIVSIASQLSLSRYWEKSFNISFTTGFLILNRCIQEISNLPKPLAYLYPVNHTLPLADIVKCCSTSSLGSGTGP
jgi:hypothetical protein